jgi:hypothetical protein
MAGEAEQLRGSVMRKKRGPAGKMRNRGDGDGGDGGDDDVVRVAGLGVVVEEEQEGAQGEYRGIIGS